MPTPSSLGPLPSHQRFRNYLQRRKADPTWATRGSGEGASGRDRHAREMGFTQLVRELFARSKEHQGWLFFSLAMLTLTALLGLVLPAATKIAIDYIATDNPGPAGLPAAVKSFAGVHADGSFTSSDRKQLLLLLGACMVATSIAAVSLGTLARWHITRVTKRVQATWRAQAFEHALHLPLHRIHHYKTGGMASLLREDAGLAGELLFTLIFNPWRAIVQLVGTLAVLAWTDYRLLLGGLLLLPTVWLTHRAWIKRIRPVLRDAKQVRTSSDATTTEAFAGVRVLRGFGRERTAHASFLKAQHYMTRLEVLAWWWSRLTDIAWALMIPTATAAVLVYGGARVVDGTLTIGDVMMFSTYLLMLLGPLETLVSTASSVQGHLAAFDRMLGLLREPREFAELATPSLPARTLAASQVHGEIVLNNVSYRYPKARSEKQLTAETDPRDAKIPEPGRVDPVKPDPSQPDPAKPAPFVLKNISLTIRAGTTVALVGPSGGGKTTLCNLIARFDDPTQGTITLDGTDLRAIDVQSYRSLLGIVEQDVFLFDGTIAQNIAYGTRSASPSQIETAAKFAAAHDFIMEIEAGYDAVIGERGVRLSGGQKQRLAIARALLASPRILLLDEATSSLDSESEKQIQASLHELRKGRTCITIAHRLSTIRSSDHIVVLEDGAIADQGTHEELLERGGLYAKWIGMQGAMEGMAR